ncbi:MAG: cupredoxin domain-containing protein [Actinomycetota bacterium]|nr:cupredoxin domain-containing protein [Actinomycetota bacterium]
MAERERTAHSTTQVFGLALITAALLVVVILTLILFGTEDVAMFEVITVVALAVTFVVWRYDKTWARILGIVATFGAGMSAFFLAFGVFQPFSPLEFIIGLIFLLGFLLALIGGIMALVAGRRGTPGPTKRETRLRTGTLGLIGIAAVVSIVGFFFTRTSVSEEEAAGAIALEMSDFEFNPSSSSIQQGDRLLITNSDAFAHDFTLEEYDLYTYFGPGGEAIVDLSDLPPGDYKYFCSLHTFEGEDGQKDGMTGTLTIES